MSKMTKKIPKAKIPRGLSDKEMLAAFVEDEETLEQQFEQAEKNRQHRLSAKQGQAASEAEEDIALALTGFTPELVKELGRALLQLKVDLSLTGVNKYSIKIKRDGQNIVLMPQHKS